MKMEVVAVQPFYDVLGSNKVRDWTSTLTPPSAVAAAAAAAVAATSNAAAKKIKSSSTIGGSSSSGGGGSSLRQQQHSINKSSINYNNNHSSNSSSSNNNNHINSSNSSKSNKKPKTSYQQHYSSSSITHTHTHSHSHNNRNTTPRATAASVVEATATPAYNFYCDEYDIDAAAVDELSLRLLDELRAAKSRHLTCTEVSLPCDLTPSIAAEIIRVSAKEPCGIRGCTIYIEFEDEPNNSRRIATLKLDPETVSTFEVYLTLRQDHRGWTALLPQFMKSLARTITISPDYTITKNKLYSTDCDGLRSSRRSYSFGSGSTSAAIATPVRPASQQQQTSMASTAAATTTTTIA